MIGVFVLDDHEVVRDGLRALLDAEEGLTVVGESADAAHAMEEIRRCRPDVAVIDLRPGDGSGLDICREIVGELDTVRCIILTSLVSDHAIVEAHEAGASAFVLKQLTNHEIVQAIREVAEGRQLLDAAAVRLAKRRIRDSDEGHLHALTRQERRIFDLIGDGMTNREIAEAMGLSRTTVKNYVSNLLGKLGVERRAEVAAIAGRLAAAED